MSGPGQFVLFTIEFHEMDRLATLLQCELQSKMNFYIQNMATQVIYGQERKTFCDSMMKKGRFANLMKVHHP